MSLDLFLSVFALIFVAELPDKTAIAILVMSARGQPLAVFFGSSLAFVIQSGVGILLGSVVGLLPEQWIRYGSAGLFFIFAALMLRPEKPLSSDEEAKLRKEKSFWSAAGAAFLVIFVAEWGDLTQILTATLEAKYHAPWTIFWASTLSLWLMSALIAGMGSLFKQYLNPKLLRYGAAVAFTGVGVYMIS